MGERTPTPWHVDGGFIRDAQGGILCVVPNNPENGKNWKNDAAFIAKVANSHDALVKALSDVLDAFGGYATPEMDGAITVMQELGLDRWSMQSSMEKSSINANVASLPSPLEGG